jgi:hypothetical protein
MFADAISRCKTYCDKNGISTDGVLILQGYLTATLKIDNPRFDEARFAKACERKEVAA